MLMDGCGSWDEEDGLNLNYDWNCGNGTSGFWVSSIQICEAYCRYSAPGEYIATLRVSDQDQACQKRDEDEASVTIFLPQ
jgi:hypothetical protein